MTKEKILRMIEQLLKLYNDIQEDEDNLLPENNLVEFVWEDENGNALYRFK